MKLRFGRYTVLTVILVLTLSSVSISHPHVFIVNRLTVVFDDQGLAGIQAKWIFDEFFSSMIAGDYDRNHNGKLENSEVNIIKKEAFSYLAEYQYFTFIKIEGKPFKVKYIRDFSASLTKGKLTYEFFIPCHVNATVAYKALTISQHDPTYYTAVFFADNRPVSYEGGSGFETTYDIAENRKESYYFGMIHPIELILKFRVKNG